MNLNYYYPSIYWATACLTINSGGADENLKGTTDYGRLSSAIGRIKAQGITVELPNINKSKFGFTPDVENNAIIYGFKGISEVGDDLINRIIQARPFISFIDFLEKIKPGKTETIALIKAGCFDKLEYLKDRKTLMYEYLQTLVPRKAKLTMANVNALIKYQCIPNNKMSFVHLFNFNKYLSLRKKGEYFDIDDRAYAYFSKNFDISYLETQGTNTVLHSKTWKKLYDTKMLDLKAYMTRHETRLIDKLHAAEVYEIWEQYCKGTISTWEMDSVGFYSHSHELQDAHYDGFDFVNFYSLPFTPKPARYFQKGDTQYPMYDFVQICGTVLDKDTNKHLVVISTPQGVVNVKLTAEHYSKYDKQLSSINATTNKKEIVERSWFKRGTKIIVSGYRNGDQFMARGRKGDNIYPLYKILDIDDLGALTITRYRADD